MDSHNEKSQHQTVTMAGSYQILRPSGLFYLLLWWLFSIKIQDKKITNDSPNVLNMKEANTTLK